MRTITTISNAKQHRSMLASDWLMGNLNNLESGSGPSITTKIILQSPQKSWPKMAFRDDKTFFGDHL